MDDVARSFFFSTGCNGLFAEARPLAARALAPAAVAARMTIAARSVRLLRAAQHDGGGAFLEGVDAHGDEADDVLVDRHGALQLLHGGRRRIDVQQGVVTLAVLLDPEGEGPEAPVFLLGD